MKYLLLTVWCSVSFSSFAFAQESVGFSDPENIRPLLDYRLPDWGYTKFYWDFSMEGSFTNLEEPLTFQPGSNFYGSFGPGYSRYRESESRTSNFITTPVFEYSSNDETWETTVQNTKSARLILPWNIEQKNFFNDTDLFISLQHTGIHRNLRVSSSEISKNISRDLNTAFYVGAGYGRLRNVNPIIRSMRLAERYQALENSNQKLSQNDIINTAEHFTRRSGYDKTYDRPMKYFWNDLNGLISPDLNELDPFDLLYLTDTEFENIGSRLEGWEIDLSIGLIYDVSYWRNENQITGSENSNLSRQFDLNPRISFRWFKNLTLEHQLGFQSWYSYRTRLYESSSNLSFIPHVLNSSFNWIYTITDRLLTNTSVTHQYYGRNSKNINHLLTHSVTVRTEINYFLENRISLFTNVSFNLARFEAASLVAESGRRLMFNTGLRYYLKRGLY